MVATIQQSIQIPQIDPAEYSPAEHIARLPLQQQQAFYDSLSEEEADLLLYDWEGFWARPKQRFPQSILQGFKDTWMIMAGRGWGKSRCGAEAVKLLVEKGYRHIALVARVASDARDVMVEGVSGILSVFPPGQKPLYEPAKRKLTFVNGAIAHTYSADKPDQLRGPQHDAAWCDELAAWRYDEAYDQLMFGLRIGTHPIAVITTTPRPTAIVRELVADPDTVLTHGSTFENAGNLAGRALKKLLKKYAGTRLGLQELDAQILDDTPGALWTRETLEHSRVSDEDVPDLVRVVVAVDPSVTATEESDETGIVAAGVDRHGHFYVLDDYSLVASPNEWAQQVVDLYDLHDADKIIAEVNQGGDMVETTIRTVRKNISFKQIRATKGKYTRAEPVSSLYEQGLVHHVGVFSELEDQMCTWVPGDGRSPDRLDALVWALTELGLKNKGRRASGRTHVTNMYSSRKRRSRNGWNR